MLDIIDTSDTTKAVMSAGVVGGVIYGMVKRKPPLGIFAYALGFGLVALAAGTVIGQLTK